MALKVNMFGPSLHFWPVNTFCQRQGILTGSQGRQAHGFQVTKCLLVVLLGFWVEVRGAGWGFYFIFVTETENTSPEGCSAERIVPIPGSLSQADTAFCFPGKKQWWLTTSAAPGRVGGTGHAVGRQETACGQGGDASRESHPATANYTAQASSKVKHPGDTDHHWWFNLNLKPCG